MRAFGGKRGYNGEKNGVVGAGKYEYVMYGRFGS